MKTKEEYLKEKELLILKANKYLIEKPSAYEEMLKIMFRLNYIKGILFVLLKEEEAEDEGGRGPHIHIYDLNKN